MSQSPEESRWPTYPGQSDPPRTEPVLPVPAAPPGFPVVPTPDSSALGRPGYSAHDPLHLSAGSGGVKKEGVWTVPPYISVHGDFGSVRLDFRRAALTSQVVWVQVSGGAGSIVFILPEGWAAQLDRVTAGIGSRKSTVAEDPVGNSPLLVLSGSMGMGSLKIRHPNRWDERRLRRQLAKEQKQLR